MTKRKDPALHKPSGQPTKYKQEYDQMAYRHCVLGATDGQIADLFGVSESTINNWKLEHPKFLESIRDGKIIADAKVAEALLNRALGYSHTEEKIFCFQGEIIRAETINHYPPDTQAASLWLRNRQPALWRDKTEVDVKTDRPLKDASEEDMLEELQLLINKKRQEIKQDTPEPLHVKRTLN